MVQAGYDYSSYQDWDIEKVSKNPQVRKIKKTDNKKKFIIKSIVLFFVYSLVLVYLCIKSATLGYQIVELENDINQLETDNLRLEYQVEQSCSLDRIEQVAVNELGMHRADKHMSIAAITPEIEPVDMNNTEPEQPVMQVGEKPLHILYTNLRILAEKNS